MFSKPQHQMTSSERFAAVVAAAIAAGGVQGGIVQTAITEVGLMDDVLGGVFWDVDTQMVLSYSQLCSVQGTGKPRERVTSYSELDELEEVDETEEAPEDTLDEQFPKDFVPAEFKKKLGISRKLRDDLEWPLMVKRPAALARAALRTYDGRMAALFNDITTGAIYKAADALSIANSAHLNKAGANSQDNLHAESLSREGVRLTRQRFREFTDARGNLLSLNLNTLVVPSELEQTALELALSDNAPHTTDRETNIYKGNLDVIVWPRLTSAVNWFGLHLQTWLDNCILMSRIAPEFKVFGNMDTDVSWVAAYLRFALGVVDWRGLIANTP